MFPALYTLQLLAQRMGFDKVVLLLCMWEAVLFFCSSRKNQASRFNFMDTDNVQNEAQASKDGDIWRI
jgi:hypothetical protein